ncbi:MAG TPA: hypothetical protein VIN40_08875 [Candidatus Tyrphobacter sp.]
MNEDMRSRFALAVLLAFALGGCSGGGGGSSAILPTNPATSGKGTGTAVFAINVPAQAPSSNARAAQAMHRGAGVRPQYLSNATQSITIAISGPTDVNETASLTVNSSGCTSSLASTICTLSVPGLQPCTSPPTNCYTATLTTYDQTGGSGNVLSAAQAIAFTITAGQSNTVNISLSGVPASTLVIPVGVFTVADGSNDDLIGLGAHKFVVESLDADGNIIAGPGAPTYTFGSLSGLGVTVTPTTTTSPNEFSVTPPGTYSASTGSFTITPTFTGQATNGCTQTGANCSAVTVTVDMKQMLAVANNGSTPGNITLYELGATSPFATITSGINNPTHLAADAAGDLFLANWDTVTTSNVLEFAAGGTSLTNTISTKTGAYPCGVAVDSLNHNLGIAIGNTCGSATGASDSLEIVDPPYSGAPTVVTTGIADPNSIAADSSGDFYVANCGTCGTGADSVTQYTASGAQVNATAYQLVDACPCPGLFVDGSGNVFVTNTVVPDIEEFAQAAATANNPPITSGVTANAHVLAGNAGNLFLANYSGTGGNIVVYDSEGTTASETITSGISGADALAFDAAGDLYVANIGLSPGIKEYPQPGTTLTNTLTTGVNNPQAILIIP